MSVLDLTWIKAYTENKIFGKSQLTVEFRRIPFEFVWQFCSSQQLLEFNQFQKYLYFHRQTKVEAFAESGGTLGRTENWTGKCSNLLCFFFEQNPISYSRLEKLKKIFEFGRVFQKPDDLFPRPYTSVQLHLLSFNFGWKSFVPRNLWKLWWIHFLSVIA